MPWRPKIGLHGRAALEERQGQAGAHARRRRSQDETFMYRWAVLALHLLCAPPAHLSDQRRDWDRRAAGPSSGHQNSLGFISVVPGHGVVVCGLPDPGDSEAPSGKTGTQLALERPGAHVPAARRVL